MISQSLDLTQVFNNNNGLAQVDVSGWTYISAHIVSPTGTVTFKVSNDGGAVTGSITPNPVSATNFTAIEGYNVGTNTYATSAAASGLFTFGVTGQFLQFASSGQTVGKLILFLSKNK